MDELRHKTRGVAGPATVSLLLAMACGSGAQTPAAVSPPAVSSQPSGLPSGSGGQVILDRVVAIVNGDLVLESDVEAEERFAAFQPFTSGKTMTKDALVERLIDRQLILQQMALQPQPPTPDADVDAELNALRKSIPKCAAYHCETDAGWQKFVEDQGFTIEQLRERWRLRMDVLRFIEERFRMGIRVQPEEIDAYYKNTMLPAYAAEKAVAPPEATIADKIQEILLQQRVDKLLDDWLTSLRAQGRVQILKPGEEAP